MQRPTTAATRRLQLMLGTATLLAACTPALPMAGADPASASAPVRQAPYRSLFTGYVGLTLVNPRPWRETNDRVRAFGGADLQMQGDPGEDAAPTQPHRHP